MMTLATRRHARAAIVVLGLVTAVATAQAQRHTLGVEWEFENFSVLSESKQDIEQATNGEKCLLRTVERVPSLGGTLPVLQLTYDLPVGGKAHERRLEVVTGPLVICSSQWHDVVSTMRALSVKIDRSPSFRDIKAALNNGAYTWEACVADPLLDDLSVSTSSVFASTQGRDVTAQTNFLMALEDLPLDYEAFLAATGDTRQYKPLGAIMAALQPVAKEYNLSPSEIGFVTLYALFEVFGTPANQIDVSRTHSQVKNAFEYFPKVMLHKLLAAAQLDRKRIEVAMAATRLNLKQDRNLSDDAFEALDRDFFSVDVVSNPVTPRRIGSQTFFLVESRGVRSALNTLWHGTLGATGYSLDLGNWKSFGLRGTTDKLLNHLTAPALTGEIDLTSCQKGEEEEEKKLDDN